MTNLWNNLQGRIYIAVVLFGLSTFPVLCNAQRPGTPTISITNPLGNTTITQFVKDLLDIVITIGVPIAVVMIIIAGLRFVTAGGNDTKISDARKMLLWTVIGTAVLLGAWLIATAIEGTINAIRGPR
jgi:hypothetical protein